MNYNEDDFRKLQDKAILFKYEFKEIQEDNLKEILSKRNTEEVAETMSIDELFASCFKDGYAEKIDKELAEWSNFQKNLAKKYERLDLITYFLENEPDKNDPLFYYKWLYIHDILKLVERIKAKNLEFSITYVSDVLYKKNPYTSEGTLPLICIENSLNQIYIYPSDPISDSFFVFYNYTVIYDDLDIWLSEMFHKPFIDGMVNSVPEEFREALCFGIVKDYYDLHGLVCSILK